jgi:putative nucleotidyltransferase with HDIG domain
MKKAKVLIVDDDPMVLALISRKLGACEYDCKIASSGTQAQEFLELESFDLVLLDVKMPGMTGMELLEIIRLHYIGTAVIMITAQKDVITAVRSMQLGAYDYVIKPVDLTLLEMTITRALERRRILVENLSYQVELEKKVDEQTRTIREAFLDSITALAYALEARDEYTSGHSQRVTSVATAIAREMNLQEGEVQKIKLAGLVHDIGKIGVKEAILNKSSRLSPEEYESIKTHCEVGERILSPVIKDPEILKMVRHHHERFDGKGYPDGLAGEQIPQGAMILNLAETFAAIFEPGNSEEKLYLGASIIAVADSYDAMTTNRPYRMAMTVEQACQELQRQRRQQFDPSVVDAFLGLLNRSGGDIPLESVSSLILP